MDDFRKRAVLVVLICAVAVLFLWLTWAARYVLLLLFASCIGALILSTFAKWLRSWIPMRRGFAFAIVITSLGLMIALLIWTPDGLLLQQIGDLQSIVPSAIRQIHMRLQSETWGRWMLAQTQDSEQLARGASFVLSGIGGAMYLTVATIAAILLVTISSLYFGAEPDFYLRGVRRIVPATYRSTFEACLTSATKTVRAWLLARFDIDDRDWSVDLLWAVPISSSRGSARFRHWPNQGLPHDFALLLGTLPGRKSCFSSGGPRNRKASAIAYVKRTAFAGLDRGRIGRGTRSSANCGSTQRFECRVAT